MAHDDQHHQHDHHHGHGHGGTHANQQYFDEQASDYDRKHQKTLDQIIREIRSRLDFLGADWVGEDEENEGPDGKPKRQVRLLDYACGTGVVSRALAPYTTQCIGLDLSQGMVDAYNRAAANQGIPPEEMRACAANLLEGDDDGPASVSGPEFRDFDVAAVGLGFHHFDDPELAARRLVRRLRPGTGVLFIIDFAPHGAFEKGHPATETVMHHGFSEARIREVFARAGAGKGFGISDMGEVVFWKGEDVMHKRRLFVARGQRED